MNIYIYILMNSDTRILFVACCFLSDNVSLLATLFEDNNWIAQLTYLADIFTKLNELNLSLHGRDTTILKL